MKTPSELIQDAFKALNPEYKVHDSTIAEILIIGCSPRAKDILGATQPFRGMPVLKYPAWRKCCSLNTAERQIKTLLRSKNLKENYEAMSQTAIYALVENGADFKTAESFANTVINAINGALTFIKKTGRANPQWKSSRSGQPQKDTQFHVVKVLADEYYKATGKEPTITVKTYEDHSAKGAFITLIETVFKILNIKKTSTEAMAKKVITLRKKRKKAYKKHKLKLRKTKGLISKLKT